MNEKMYIKKLLILTVFILIFIPSNIIIAFDLDNNNDKLCSEDNTIYDEETGMCVTEDLDDENINNPTCEDGYFYDEETMICIMEDSDDEIISGCSEGTVYDEETKMCIIEDRSGIGGSSSVGGNTSGGSIKIDIGDYNGNINTGVIVHELLYI